MSKVYRGTLFNDECRFYLGDYTDLIQQINKNHLYSPTATAALGRTTMVTSVLGLMGKDDTKVSTIIKGGGPIGTIIATADSNGNIKSKVSNPLVDVPKLSDTKLNVGAAVGNEGFLRVIKDLNVKDPFVSEVPIQSGEIGIDFAYYFTKSEQIPTALGVGVLVDKDHSIKNASLFLVQLMPNASEDSIIKLENFFNGLTNISSEMSNKNEEEFLEEHFKDDYRVLEIKDVNFKCDCSEEKFIDAIKLLSPADIIDIKKDKTINCKCDFCYKEYDIDTLKI